MEKINILQKILQKRKQRDTKEAYIYFPEMLKRMQKKRVWPILTSDKRPPRNGTPSGVLNAVAVLTCRVAWASGQGYSSSGVHVLTRDGSPCGAFALVGPSPLWGWGSCQ